MFPDLTILETGLTRIHRSQMARMNGYYDGRHYERVPQNAGQQSLGEQWRVWVEKESKRRLAWIILIQDVRLSVSNENR